MARLARDPRARRREGVWVAEGVRLAEEVIREGLAVRLWVLEEGWEGSGARAAAVAARIRERGDPVMHVRRGLLREVADTRTPQGVVVAFVAPPWPRGAALRGRRPVVVLDRVQDPGNLGTIARTAEAAGCSGLLLTPGCADPGSPKALRASAGSLLRLPAGRCEHPLEDLAARGVPLAATVRCGGAPPDALDLSGRFALLLGQEGAGLDPALEAAASVRITVPMEGRVESLNVAATAAVVLFEAQRQRRAARAPAP